MFLKKIIKAYLSLGLYADCFLYRKTGIFLIIMYQTSLRKIYSRQCQFKISCSRLFKDQLKNNDDITDLFLTLNKRMEDCSEPLSGFYSPASGLNAVGVTGQRYTQDELSDEYVKRQKHRLQYQIN